MKDKLYPEIKKSRGLYLAYLDTPIGTLEFTGDEKYLLSVMFVEEKTEVERRNPIVEEATKQFSLYFQGKLGEFSL
ncbi:MAG: hypothetical protein ACRC4Z_03000, partial [Fusobacteriaceae bacterium]